MISLHAGSKHKDKVFFCYMSCFIVENSYNLHYIANVIQYHNEYSLRGIVLIIN